MALDWVKGEIEDTLDRAREALESYADHPDDITLARQCLTSLHQVNGTLQMVELSGAATLAGEMEALAQALLNQSVADGDRAQEALMEGILQLPSHLNRVHRGAEDDPRVHALLIDRMRVARGEAALSRPGELAVDPAAITAYLSGRGPEEVRKVRAAFQKAMVALLRDTQPPEKMYRFFDKAFSRLEQLVPASPLRSLWSVAAGAMEAGGAAGDDPKVHLPLLRGLDQQLKDLVQAAEATLVAQPPVRLFDGLRAIVEASSHDSPRLAGLRASLSSAAGTERAEPIGADEDTIAVVAAALHEELGGVRDRLDLFVRGSVSDVEDLAALGVDLQRIAGTLQVAGLDELRETMARQSAWLKSQANAADVDDEAVMEVASAVLFVDGELMRLAGIESDDADGMPGSLSDAQTAVLKEARASLEAVKQGIVDFIASDWEHSHLSAVPDTLTSVRSVLELVPLERAAALVDQARLYVDDEVLKPLLVPEWQRLDNLADAITSIDYYLERLIEDRVIPDPRLLEIAEESISLLRPGEATGAAPMPGGVLEGDAAFVDDLEITEADLELPDVGSPEERLSGEDAALEGAADDDLDATDARGRAEAAPVERTQTEAFDLSLDEDLGATDVRAPEEMPPVERMELDDFDLAADEDLDATDVRAPEEMPQVERVESDEFDLAADEDLDATAVRAPEEPDALPPVEHPDFDLAADEDLDATYVRAPEEMPQDVTADLAGGVDAARASAAELEAGAPSEAESTPAGDDVADTAPAAVPPEETARPESSAAADAPAPAGEEEDALIDEEILEIFQEEVVEVLENMDAALPVWSARRDDSDALSELRRAWHTLKGSGRMVGASVIGELAWSIENMLNRVIDGTIDASPAVVDLVESARARIPQLRVAFAEQRAPEIDVTPWMERADLLASGGSAEDLESVPLPDTEAAQAPPADEPSSHTAPVEDDFDLGDVTEVPMSAGVDAEDEPSALTAPVEEDFDLGEAPETATPEEAVLEEASVSDVTAGDEPSALTAPVEDDFDLGEALETATPEEVALEEAPGSSVAAGDEPSALTAPAEDDFDLGASVDAATEAAGAPEESIDPDVHAGDEPSSLTAPVEDDFDLGGALELPGDDAPAALTEPVEADVAPDSAVAAEQSAPSAADAGVFRIFEQEALEHLAVIRGFVTEARSRGGVAPLSEALRRALHTLKGSAAMAEYSGLAALAAPLEGAVRAYLELRREADDRLSDVVERGLERIEEGLEVLRSNGREAPLAEPDRDYLHAATALLDRLDSELRSSAAAGTAGSQREIFSSENVDVLLDAASVLGEWMRAGVTSRVEALRTELAELSNRARRAGQSGIAALADALQDAHERLGVTLPADARPVLEGAHDTLMSTLDALAAGLDVPPVEEHIAQLRSLGTASTPDAAQQIRESVAGLDLDPEMVEIFFEEADEILEAIEGALEAWPAGDASAADQIMRSLHTLKGGARMAGLTGLGDEAHHLETWIGERRASADGAFFRALRERADVMAEHVAMLRRGEVVVRDVAGEGAGQGAATEAPRPMPEGEPAPAIEELPAAPPPAAEPASPAPVESTPASAMEADIDDDVAETDPEILALFLEEAAELTEILDGSLQGWRDEPGNEIHMESVLRALHTLKGGARMAGLMALGERVHELEARIIERHGSSEDLDAEFLARVQTDMDALSGRIAGLSADSGDAAGVEPVEPIEVEPPLTAIDTTVLPPAPPAPPPASPPVPTPAKAADVEAASPMRESAKDAPQEMIRVSAGLLDELVNLAGETSIMRGRVQQQISDFGGSLDELSATIERLRDQVRRLDSEAQEQLLSKQEAFDRAERAGYEDFDPLEMDRYTQLQELTRTLAESASDITDLRDTLAERLRDTDTLLVQQGRINTELQEGLMRTRMVPFARLLPRLKRIVRQVGRELGKPVDLVVENAEGELDRNVLERMIAPLEHMLRNAVDHGLETPEARSDAGKPPQGTVRLRLDRDGGDILVQVADDGAGIDVAGVRAKAVERGLLEPDAKVSDAEILSFIMAAGFSTAKSVTQISGRGVGMDVVNSEVKQLGGTISIASKLGEGTTFTVRLPFTVSVNRALMVQVGNDVLAVPLNGIEGIVRVSPAQLASKYESGAGASFSYAGRDYALSYLGEWLGDPRRVPQDVPSIPIIMVRSGNLARAVHVDSIAGSREIVVKSLGAQFAGVGGISGATIMGDGSVVVILDLPALLRTTSTTLDLQGASDDLYGTGEESAGPTHVMVVDDSVTVRKVTTRLLERKGYRVSVAKDGVEAVAALAEEKPDVMLLDIEMPRMDGFEVATHVRNEAGLSALPIVMITSRTGEKHRERAEAIGVNRFLGKPFQEVELLAEIEMLTS
jgi:chemosensory pili system protein ChpA (sensor histidine kinase/response regulator)